MEKSVLNKAHKTWEILCSFRLKKEKELSLAKSQIHLIFSGLKKELEEHIAKSDINDVDFKIMIDNIILEIVRSWEK